MKKINFVLFYGAMKVGCFGDGIETEIFKKVVQNLYEGAKILILLNWRKRCLNSELDDSSNKTLLFLHF